jgi:hypothetical protein
MGPVPYSALGFQAPVAVPEVAPWLARMIDSVWVDMGRPDPWTVVEVGAGDGQRAAAVLSTTLECARALRYVAVEEDPRLRAGHSGHLPVESPILVLGPVGSAEDDEGDDEDPAGRPAAGIGPLATSLAEPPVLSGPALVVTVGWAGRLPSDRVEWRDGCWWEIRLAATAGPDNDLEEMAVPLDRASEDTADGLVPAPRPDPSRYARLGDAVRWLGAALRVAPEGRLAVIDRWTRLTEPLVAGQAPPLALDQLATVRRPQEAAPEELCPGWSVVTWWLG